MNEETTFDVRIICELPAGDGVLMVHNLSRGKPGSDDFRPALWGLPGGGYSPKDGSHEAAALRELREETGLRPEGGGLVLVGRKDKSKNHTQFFFSVGGADFSQETTLTTKGDPTRTVDRAEWVSYENLLWAFEHHGRDPEGRPYNMAHLEVIFSEE